MPNQKRIGYATFFGHRSSVIGSSHLATRKTRHQQTRHQYEISYYIKSKPNMIFSEA